MLDKKMIEKELSELINIRTEIFKYLDKNISKKENNIEYDFSENPTLEAQKIYEYFFKLDYQARKLRGFLVEAYGIE